MQNNYLTYYQLLGVETNATTEQILKAYKEKAKKYHPDLNNNSDPANDMLKYINQAKEWLTDPQKRLQYDYLIGVRQKPEPSPKTVYVNKENNNSNPWGAAIAGGLLGLIIGVAIAGRK